MMDDAIQAYYAQGQEQDRLLYDGGTLELVRTQELLQRYLPPLPATVLDVGGGPGVYAGWLARLGYHVHLIDPISLHVAQARERAAAQSTNLFTAALGDIRHLVEPDASVDAVLCLGPLYHVTDRSERLVALAEVRRVLRPRGIALVVGISCFATLLDGLRQGILHDPLAHQIVVQDVADGQHRNPDVARYPGWFTTAYFHRPEELAAEVTESGLLLQALIGIEGPGDFIGHGWAEREQRSVLLWAARVVEQEPNLLGLSPHLLAVAQRGW